MIPICPRFALCTPVRSLRLRPRRCSASRRGTRGPPRCRSWTRTATSTTTPASTCAASSSSSVGYACDLPPDYCGAKFSRRTDLSLNLGRLRFENTGGFGMDYEKSGVMEQSVFLQELRRLEQSFKYLESIQILKACFLIAISP